MKAKEKQVFEALLEPFKELCEEDRLEANISQYKGKYYIECKPVDKQYELLRWNYVLVSGRSAKEMFDDAQDVFEEIQNEINREITDDIEREHTNVKLHQIMDNIDWLLIITMAKSKR